MMNSTTKMKDEDFMMFLAKKDNAMEHDNNCNGKSFGRNGEWDFCSV